MGIQHVSQTFHLLLPGYLIIRKLIVSKLWVHSLPYISDHVVKEPVLWCWYFTGHPKGGRSHKRSRVIPDPQSFGKVCQGLIQPQRSSWLRWWRPLCFWVAHGPCSDNRQCYHLVHLLAVTPLASLSWSPPTSPGYDPLVNPSPIPVVTPFPNRLVWPPSPAHFKEYNLICKYIYDIIYTYDILHGFYHSVSLLYILFLSSYICRFIITCNVQTSERDRRPGYDGIKIKF